MVLSAAAAIALGAAAGAALGWQLAGDVGALGTALYSGTCGALGAALVSLALAVLDDRNGWGL